MKARPSGRSSTLEERIEMNVGMLLVFQNWHRDPELSDEQMFLGELQIAEQAEAGGYHSIWAVEHHFDDYAMCPDNFQVLAYLAAKTSTITLATGACILPWNDPLRVAEKTAVLDHLTGGRLILGMGRGLSPMEYEGFRQDLNESRERFDESAAMILAALDSGEMTGDGPFYNQPRVDLRPRPNLDRPSFRERSYSVAMSPGSVAACAELGTGLMTFKARPMESHKEFVDIHQATFREKHGREAPNAVFAEFVCVHEDREVAKERANVYTRNYGLSVLDHYQTGKLELWSKTTGYESYGVRAAAIQEQGIEATAQEYVDSQLSGTPDDIVEAIKEQREIVGDFDLLTVFSFGGMPFDIVQENYDLFTKDVLPRLQAL